jgi:type II secretory pathway pseudopilin PulG
MNCGTLSSPAFDFSECFEFNASFWLRFSRKVSALTDISFSRRKAMENQLSFGGVTAPRRKGLAVASLVMGILSIILCSLFLVGPIVGIVLGILAINKANKQPQEYEGKGLAIAGIVLSALSIFTSGVIAAIAIPNLVKSQQAARETAALREVQAIGSAQLMYSLTKGEGRFTNLRTLGQEGLIDSTLATGQKGGFVFTSEPVNGGTIAMFDTTARPVEAGSFGTGNRSFYSNESNVVFESNGNVPPKATPQDRVPKNGSPVF